MRTRAHTRLPAYALARAPRAPVPSLPGLGVRSPFCIFPLAILAHRRMLLPVADAFPHRPKWRLTK